MVLFYCVEEFTGEGEVLLEEYVLSVGHFFKSLSSALRGTRFYGVLPCKMVICFDSISVPDTSITKYLSLEKKDH